MRVSLNVLCLLFLLRTGFLSGQDKHKVDSMRTYLNTAKKDTIYARTMNILSDQLCASEPDTAMHYAMRALELSEKLDFGTGIGNAYSNIANVHRFQGKYLLAIEYYEKGLAAFKDTWDVTAVGSSYNNMGNVYVEQGNYNKALEKFMEGLKVFEKIGLQSRIAASLANIGTMFQYKGGTSQNMRDYTEALKYHTRALEIDRELAKTEDRRFDVSVDLNNLASVYIDIYKMEPSVSTLAKAMSYLEESMKLKQEVNDGYGLAIVNVNIADVKLQQGKFFRLSAHFKESVVYGKKALKMFQEVGEPYGSSHTMNKIAQAFGEQYILRSEPAMLDSSLVYFKAGLKTAKEIEAKDLMRELYNGLSEVYELKKDYKEALAYQKMYAAIKDTILNEENTRSMNEMETKYQTAEKDKELIVKNAEITKGQAEAKQKAAERNAFIIGFGLVLILAFFIFRSYRQKRKDNIIITEQKKEVEFQKHIIEEKNKEVMDSITYARRIQRSLLPTEKYIVKSLKRLQKE